MAQKQTQTITINDLDQLRVGRDAFVNMLTASLAQGETE